MLLLLAFDEFYSLCSFYFVDNTKEIRISRSSEVGYITSLHFPAKYNSSTVSNTYRYVLLNPYGRIEVKLTDWDLLPGSTFNVSDLWVTRNSRTKCWALCCCYWTFPIFGLNMRIIMFIAYIEKLHIHGASERFVCRLLSAMARASSGDAATLDLSLCQQANSKTQVVQSCR